MWLILISIAILIIVITCCFSDNWRDYNQEPPPINTQILAFSEKWVDADWNPHGIRIGFVTDNRDFMSAIYWHHEIYSSDNIGHPQTWKYLEKV